MSGRERVVILLCANQAHNFDRLIHARIHGLHSASSQLPSMSSDPDKRLPGGVAPPELIRSLNIKVAPILCPFAPYDFSSSAPS